MSQPHQRGFSPMSLELISPMSLELIEGHLGYVGSPLISWFLTTVWGQVVRLEHAKDFASQLTKQKKTQQIKNLCEPSMSCKWTPTLPMTACFLTTVWRQVVRLGLTKDFASQLTQEKLVLGIN